MFGYAPFTAFSFTEIEITIPTAPVKILYGGARPYNVEIEEYNEDDDEEFIIMALVHQLIEMRVI